MFKKKFKYFKKILHSKCKNFFGGQCDLIHVDDDQGVEHIYCTCTHDMNPETYSIKKKNKTFYVLHDEKNIHLIDGNKGFACILIVWDIWFTAVTQYEIDDTTYIVYKRKD